MLLARAHEGRGAIADPAALIVERIERWQRVAIPQRSVQQGVARYGTNFVSEPSLMLSGETGGFTAIDVALVTIMQAPPLYHTTGEILDVISTPGTERMARFLAFFVRQAGKAPVAAINPPGSGPRRGAEPEER